MPERVARLRLPNGHNIPVVASGRYRRDDAGDLQSVLIELGFLSNASDMANLMQSDWQDRTAEAIARGISTYFDSLEEEQ